MSPDPLKPVDRFRFFVYFIVGAALGLIIGVIIVTRLFATDMLYIVLIILVSSFLVGTVSAVFGDRFWNWFIRRRYWWW
jgi:uncharacterized membrane protein